MKRITALLAAILLLSACASTQDKMKDLADSGDTDNQFNLGTNYYLGSNGITKNKSLAIKYLTMATENEHTLAMFNLAKLYEEDENLPLALKYYQHAAEKDLAQAQDNLAIMYKNGKGVTKNLTKAAYWFQRGAENGSTLSNRNLAFLYSQSGQNEKAIEVFSKLVFSPSIKNNSNDFKKFIALQLMDLHIQTDNKEQAYLWGAIGIFSGVFDSRIKKSEEYFNRFNDISKSLTTQTKKSLAKTILINHYQIFQKNQPYLKRKPQLKFEDGMLVVNGKETFSFLGYSMKNNIKTMQKAKYYEGKNTENDLIQFALSKFKLASLNITFASISPNILMANTYMTEGLEALDKNENSNVTFLKKYIAMRLEISKNVNEYFSQIHDHKQTEK